MLAFAWYFALIYFRRLKYLKSNEQLLEELLYYAQVSEIHASDLENENLPVAIKKIQLNRDAFIADLKIALMDNQFILHYQPVIDISTGKIVDVEVLIRWHHPIHGLLSPSVFLPLCENSPFMITLGKWVLRTACHQYKKWCDSGFSSLSISINLSTTQLNDPQLLSLITETLKQNNIPPSRLKFEITEHSLMRDVESSVKLLQSLRNLGVQLSLDDFGTGYSSLKYLKQLPISNLKIDRTFIHDMTTNITSLAIVESIIVLAKSLGLGITAEGVENKNQLHMLKNMKCDLIQGYIYSKPISADEFTQLLYSSKSMQQNKMTDLLSNNNNYSYTVLKNEHYDQAIDVISEAFCESEPMTKYLGITNAEFVPFAKLLLDKAIRDGLSIVALDNGKVIACTIVEDITNPLNVAVDLDPRFKIIFSLLESLSTDFFNDRAPYQGQIAHLFITAVDKKYHSQGLSKKINFESIRLAKEKGFDFMCCEFTHDFNEKGTVKNLKNSRLLIRSCNYKDFIFEDKKPFENLEGAASAYIWELREGVQLNYQ